MTEYADLEILNDALGVLVGYKIITLDERVKMTSKFLNERPAFKESVSKSMRPVA